MGGGSMLSMRTCASFLLISIVHCACLAVSLFVQALHLFWVGSIISLSSLWTGLKTFTIDMRYCDQGSHGSDPAADGSSKADICKPINRIMITHPQLVGLGNPLVSDHQNIMAQYENYRYCFPKPPKAQLPKPYPAAKHTLCVAQNQCAKCRRASTPWYRVKTKNCRRANNSVFIQTWTWKGPIWGEPLPKFPEISGT